MMAIYRYSHATSYYFECKNPNYLSLVVLTMVSYINLMWMEN